MSRPLLRRSLSAAAALAGVGTAAALWGMGVERQLFTVRRHFLRILPPGSPQLRVLHVSDAHMAPWQRHKQRWMSRLAEVQPDLVVNTGDNLGHPAGLAGIRRAFAPLQGVPGVFVHGSNDVNAPQPRNWLRYIAGPSQRKAREIPLDTASLDRYLCDDLGWHDLNNTTATLEVAGLRIDAFGVSDAHREWDDLEALPPLRASQRAHGHAGLTIGVTHAPYARVLDAFVDLGAELLVAGHTHGGQVRVPFSPRALVANCDIPLDQARGLSGWEHEGREVPLNVSAGLGTSIYAPVRFGCRPEASLLTLLPRLDSSPSPTAG